MRKANSVFGGLVFVEFAINLVIAPCSIFFATGIFDAVGHGLLDPCVGIPGVHLPMLCLRLGKIIIAADALYKVWILQKTGQRLCATYKVWVKSLCQKVLL